MLGYTIKRTLVALATIVMAMICLFLLMRAIPGDPASTMLGPQASPALVAEINRRLSLDQPVYIQIWRFLSTAASGDLGRDVFSNRPVLEIVLGQLPYTIALALVALAWAIVIAIPLGCISAIRPNSIFDRVSSVISVAAIAIPSFIIALYLLLLFAVSLRMFPAIGAGRPGDWLSQAHHLVLPAFAVGLGWVGYLARLVRASMLEVMGENHIRSARAFGIPEARIVVSYALPIAILPVITVIGSGLGRLLAGAVFAEIVFTRPGIGYLVYSGVVQRNYPIVIGGVLVTTVLYVVCTLLADLANAALNPKIRDRLSE